MTLANEHIPLPCSLRERVSSQFAPMEGELSVGTIPTETLIGFLSHSEPTDATPMITIRRLAEEKHSTAGISAEDSAAIEWVTLAFEFWEQDYPVESPLDAELQRMQPLAVALALKDPAFFTPGGHPLHKLLDSLQHSAVGWQGRLERAGQMLEQRIGRAVERSLHWFQDRSVDFEPIVSELAASAERDEERASRMIQRLAEAEEASVKTRVARREAASVINEGLASCELPVAVGKFLKGPWYDSLQLVALRHGTTSQEWREIARITRQLMDSVQPSQGGGGETHSASLRRLSGELRHWLLSLQHDKDGADDAIGLIEYAHLRLRHGQDLGLTHIPPLPVPGSGGTRRSAEEAGPELDTGQWYRLQDDEGDLRAQLTLQLQDGQHLLFTNVVGLKAIDMDRASFIESLASGETQQLPTQDTFSLSLANAAGIDTHNKLRALIDPSFIPPPEPVAEEKKKPEAVANDLPEQDSVDKNKSDAAPADTEAPEELTGEPVIEPVTETSTGHKEDHPAAAHRPSTPAREPESEAAALDSLELELIEPQQQRAAAKPTGAAARVQSTGAAQESSARLGMTRMQRTPQEPDMDVPMGAWLGFHDGETPMMAKLAVYDPRREVYIFVNRRGIALREISRSDLLALIDEGLVDILETRCYFRDEVERVRGQSSD